MAISSSPPDVDHLQDRVCLYLQVMLVIDVFSRLSDMVTPFVLDEYTPPEVPPLFGATRWGVTVLVVAAWSFVRFAKPGRTALAAIESGVTLGLVLVYVHMASAYFAGTLSSNGPLFALFGIALLLVVRSSLVPSPVSRTVLIGLASMVCLFVIMIRMPTPLDPVVLDAMSFVGGAFIIATAVTSHVIYGLRRQVRHASRLGQYELGRKLGEGGMGVVYEATHLMLRRPTAVKLLPADKAGQQTVARFEREVQQTSRLEHPNSVSIYDYGRTPEGQFYYAMELLDGLTLQQLVDVDGRVGAARTGLILQQAALALAEAHAMGLIHRDIKPANIMLCERARVPDTVKVLDFGLVKVVDSPDLDDNITQGNTVLGTPHYLAPEAITDPAAVGAPSDVYALGAIGFYLLTGREVFTGSTVVEVCAKHLRDAPESPSAVLGEATDPGFEALIRRCLSKEPGDRPPDGATLAREIEQLGLTGWTAEDAGAWWREFRTRQRGQTESRPAQRTQLAVDVEGRG